jgi:hypothetical protein
MNPKKVATIPKKAKIPGFGFKIPRLRIPKRAANPHQTALFGIRSKTVQYVQYVLKI